jgi:hypothetical protein
MRLCGEAIIELFPKEAAGLETPVTQRFRSLLLYFPSVDDLLGVSISPLDADEIQPGQTGRVLLEFWAEEARIWASKAGTGFSIRYPIRNVGQGTIVVPVEWRDK